ncbi:MAG TPA: dipeptidase [Gammaproteobacteria bacterium]|nr:dipeptidase [Gammaproteobacteria bacterium]
MPRKPSLALAAVLLAACAEPPDYAAHLDEARRIAAEHIIVDTHIDVPYRLREELEDIARRTEGGDFDYPRAREGGLDAAFMSIYVPPRYETSGGAIDLADELIDLIEKLAADAPDKFAMAYSPDDVRSNFVAGRMSFALGMENGAPIAGDLDNLRHFHARGIRYITLAHSKSNHIADSSFDTERPWQGLSEFGEAVVGEMNRLGLMIDVSHISDDAFRDVIALTRAPVIASHSSARHFTPGFERNMSDDMIVALAENGGVIQINFGSAFLTAEASAWLTRYLGRFDEFVTTKRLDPESDEATAFRDAYIEKHPLPFASLDDVLDHIDHVVAVAGVDHVGLGSDFDGVGDSLPVGLKDVSGYPNLIAGLLLRGYSKADIEKILSGNILRVWTEVEAQAAAPAAAPPQPSRRFNR